MSKRSLARLPLDQLVLTGLVLVVVIGALIYLLIAGG